jgi:hypothetical protein
VAHKPPESIKSPDEQNVAAAKFLKTGIKPRTVVSRAGCLFGEDQFVGNSALLQSNQLEIEVLAACADAGVPDQTNVWRQGNHIPNLAVKRCCALP